MERHFPELVDIQFTAQMEQVLDDIADGETEGVPYLRTFYLGDTGLDQQVKTKDKEINPREIHALVLDEMQARVRIGPYGPYLEQDNNGELIRVSLPDSVAPADLGKDDVERLLKQKGEGPTPLGYHPETGEPIFVLIGPYGPYVQMGENGDSGNKPRRVSLLKDMKANEITLEQAVALLQLPRKLGQHPETGKEVEAGIGRFGPFVRHDGEYRSLPKDENVLTIGLNRAVELLAEKKKSRRAELIRELGPHPEDKEIVAIYEGRYGPYIKHGKTNAALPKNVAHESLTLETALPLLTAKKTQKSTKKKKSS
jgi:DNA topoisomerase-1